MASLLLIRLQLWLTVSIISYCHKDWYLLFGHTLRDGNFVADTLAKRGVNFHESLLILNEYPQDLLSLCFADSIGVPTVRLH